MPPCKHPRTISLTVNDKPVKWCRFCGAFYHKGRWHHPKVNKPSRKLPATISAFGE